MLNDLQNQSFIDSIREKIDPSKVYSTEYYGPALNKTDHGTAHMSFLGPNGDAVSLTSTINNYFGAKYSGKQTGIIYNDCMDDFSTPNFSNSFGYAPTTVNYIEPGKQPLSSMCPLIVTDKNGDVKLILGGSGGSKIVSALSQVKIIVLIFIFMSLVRPFSHIKKKYCKVVIKLLYMKSDLKEAIDARRIHHQLFPQVLLIENEFTDVIKSFFLINLNHLRRLSLNFCFQFTQILFFLLVCGRILKVSW